LIYRLYLSGPGSCFCNSKAYICKSLVCDRFEFEGFMQQLNLPCYPFRLVEKEGKKHIFDAFRGRYVVLTPEEWVRQHFLSWLVSQKGYPRGLISVEAPLKYHRLSKRADAIVYSNTGKPLMIVECKAPHIKITQDVFDQIGRYNFPFGVGFLTVTNGLIHYCCKRDETGQKWVFLEEIPLYEQL